MAETASEREEKLWDLIEGIRTAMLSTVHDGRIESRPMSAYFERDRKLIWFITRLDSGKTHEIGPDAPVNLAFVDERDRVWVSVSGHAAVVRDPAKQRELWNPFAEAWIPEGPDAPEVGLIRVEPTDATYWDSPSSRLALLWQVARANITRTPPAAGDVEQVQIG